MRVTRASDHATVEVVLEHGIRTVMIARLPTARQAPSSPGQAVIRASAAITRIRRRTCSIRTGPHRRALVPEFSSVDERLSAPGSESMLRTCSGRRFVYRLSSLQDS